MCSIFLIGQPVYRILKFFIELSYMVSVNQAVVDLY